MRSDPISQERSSQCVWMDDLGGAVPKTIDWRNANRPGTAMQDAVAPITRMLVRGRMNGLLGYLMDRWSKRYMLVRLCCL